MKQHLVGARGAVEKCKKVPSDVRFLFQGALEENAQKAKEKRGSFDEMTSYGQSLDDFNDDEDEEL